MSSDVESVPASTPTYYKRPAQFYCVCLAYQFMLWFNTSSAALNKPGLLVAMILTLLHVYIGFIMPKNKVTILYWMSCILWFISIITCIGAYAFPAPEFLIFAGVALMMMYEGYAKELNDNGCTTLRQNFFPRIFVRGKIKTRQQSDYSNGPSNRSNITAAVRPVRGFDSIIGMDQEKKRIKDASLEIIRAHKNRAAARNGILLTGEPGNGKTALAKALAGELKLPFVELTNGLVASPWVNETTVNLMKSIQEAKSRAPCVLLIDEIDSFLGDRGANKGSNSEDGKIVNTLLTELVNLRSFGVVIVAATNHVAKLDGAGIREGRFDFKIEVVPPNEQSRELILLSELIKFIDSSKIQLGAVETAAKRWDGFSVVRILSVAKEMASIHKSTPYSKITSDDIFSALRKIQGTQGLPVDNAKGIDQMLLPDGLKDDLRSIVYRMKNIQHIEESGGSLPTGLVFYGSEPGTGKTECARSLAKDSGWAFLATTSNDLIADTGLIDKLYKEALNIRPCIIFIDEANDVLRDRAYSNNSAVTNKLLTVMDGVSNEKRDILFVAATNYIEHIDQAVLRGGRISEKYFFDVPETSMQVTFIQNLMNKSKTKFSAEVSPERIVYLLDHSNVKGTVANMCTVIQDAVNAKLYRGEGTTVEVDDINKAIARQTLK
ncbi:AAA family ATPase [Undibacterium sp. RTI2.1]|uniref:AAA family ATPase n=1 Tax=unclassified Undibacterium TaxID=2630295 RepID=UPI002B23A7DA|nr:MULTISPECIES: AAA family ATPase [unclassified Undibacterium]MEB0033073.1 AAA family ATPase [Undibacterium sp. RTI2.1]MEB0118933.1 AAA family ATPase [Undibacterium sp. RTI2.2]